MVSACAENGIAAFTGDGLDEKVMISYLEIALNYKKKGIIDRIRLSTRPDYINNSILDILKKYEVNDIAIGKYENITKNNLKIFLYKIISLICKICMCIKGIILYR